MNEVKQNMVYENGNRVETVKRTSTKADDYDALGNRYIQLAALLRSLSTAANDEAKTAINTEIAKVTSEISEYEGYIAGYDTAAEAADGDGERGSL